MEENIPKSTGKVADPEPTDDLAWGDETSNWSYQDTAGKVADPEPTDDLAWGDETSNWSYQDTAGWTALNAAAFAGYNAVVDLLLSSKPNPYFSESRGQTALHAAVAFPSNLLLTSCTLDPYIAENRDSGTIPLHAAARAGHRGVVELLLRNKTDPYIAENRDTSNQPLSACLFMDGYDNDCSTTRDPLHSSVHPDVVKIFNAMKDLRNASVHNFPESNRNMFEDQMKLFSLMWFHVIQRFILLSLLESQISWFVIQFEYLGMVKQEWRKARGFREKC